ncbi:MAG: tRNA lysidine(34) synthetase TilS C-terminal domain-containing protein [Planctomycetota bacterium]|nr:tRNA lysidine(34) synthetase TilS C-terminal domain-containing protein [Planctomycetota bacterium]
MKMFIDGKTVFEEFVDLSKISKPLMFRFPKRKDMFHPLGQPKERRLMSFLKDCKIPHNERDQCRSWWIRRRSSAGQAPSI